jgi:biotin carboxyl carrier protein
VSVFEVEVNGRTRSVDLERDASADGRFRVTVDGRAAIVDVRRDGQFGISMLFPASRASAVVHLAPGSAPGELLAALGGRSVPVVVNGRRTGRLADTGAAAHGEQKLAAPMPGRVVRVLVGVGDEVQARQPVIVVEAMKMENELRSPKAGRVKEVTVGAGTSVEAGKVLVVIE